MQLFELFVKTMASQGVAIHEHDIERAEIVIDAVDGESLPAPVRVCIPTEEAAAIVVMMRDHLITPPGESPADPAELTVTELVDDLKESIRGSLARSPDRITFRRGKFVYQLTPSEIVELARANVTHVRTDTQVESFELDPLFRVPDYAVCADDPLPLLDAILEHESGDDVIVTHLGAGPLEDLLHDRRDQWPRVDDRARRQPVWAAAASGSWLPGHLHDQLPEPRRSGHSHRHRNMTVTPGPAPLR
ncbi:hypothetical protein [Occultella kanbiaonis]|uniref:hypothetical protein n=1 Tax=Occultella kanbiaonis TaxID=2675754 RepID=UPI0013D0DB3B|nr:hypothetical protein [Occultella kanbiaonis]